jgi:hypothetical protein
MKRLLTNLVAAVAAAAFLAGGGGAASSARPPTPKQPPAITGTAQQGSTLSTTPGIWDGDTPITFRYQWLRCDSKGGSCSDISGAAAQAYALASADVGRRVRVHVIATNAAGSAAADSQASALVAAPGQAPSNTSRPSISGDFHERGTIVANVGKWAGSVPISFTLAWQRCVADGSACSNISGANRSSYVLTSSDLGRRMRVVVTGTNKYGASSRGSSLSDVPVVTTRGSAPSNTAVPTIGGSPQVAQTLTLNAGTWKGSTPMTFAYAWQRCDKAGANCAAVSGASSRTYKIASGDVGYTLRGLVTGANTFGTTTAVTAATAPVSVPLPSGAVKLPSGLISLPVTSIALPERLIIDQISFSPATLSSRNPFVGRFRVRDTRGYVIRDALVLVIGVPFGRIRPAPEVVTSTDGVATVELSPTARLPLVRGGSLVLFLRARKPGDSVLAGVSTRRLVSIRTARP